MRLQRKEAEKPISRAIVEVILTALYDNILYNTKKLRKKKDVEYILSYRNDKCLEMDAFNLI